MLKRLLLSATLATWTAPALAQSTQMTAFQEITPVRCGDLPPFDLVSTPLPAAVSGRVSLYIAEYDPRTFQVIQARGLGEVNAIQPLASSYKGFMLEAVMRDVDARKLALNQKFVTTAANRSIEAYPAGTNTLQTLATRAIRSSDNTAADILHLAYGTERLARLIQKRSPCTAILMTNKAMWAAQAGLLPNVLGPDVTAGASLYARLAFDDRIKMANQLVQESQKVLGPTVETELDKWFMGPSYTPQVDLELQYTSTAKALTDLIARTYAGNNLGSSRKIYRDIMKLGCCQPKKPRLVPQYWATKAGSGWRFVSMTGYVELTGGRVLAYTYLNDLSQTRYASQMESQIRPVLGVIEENLMQMSAAPRP